MKISIVTPSYNQGTFLEETILSVIQQNYPELEYVIIDGESSDESIDIIKKYSSYLDCWESEKDNGHAHAINKGFEHTTGEIMAWLNSDDKYLPWTLKTVAEIFTTFPDVNWIVGFNSWWNDKGVMTHAARCPKNIYDFLLGNYAWIQQESVFWRRSLWDLSGGFVSQDYKHMVDGELWSRFFLHDKLYAVDCILGGYRIHASNRAKLQYSYCIDEMKNIIKIMRAHCSQEVIKNYKDLNLARFFNKNPIMKQFPFNKLTKSFFENAYKSSEYDLIRYIDKQWQCSKLQFNVF